MFDIDEMVWNPQWAFSGSGDTDSFSVHLFIAHDLFYINQKPPPPQTGHMTITFLYDGNFQLVDIYAIRSWYKK